MILGKRKMQKSRYADPSYMDWEPLQGNRNSREYFNEVTFIFELLHWAFDV